MARLLLTDRSLNPAGVAAEVAAATNGARVTFVGTVRRSSGDREVTHLTNEVYEPLARKAMAAIIEEVEAAHDGLTLAIHHRFGWLGVGEESVVVAAAAPHRREAFAGCAEAVDRLKRTVPIWKREHYADGSSGWREEEVVSAPDD